MVISFYTEKKNLIMFFFIVLFMVSEIVVPWKCCRVFFFRSCCCCSVRRIEDYNGTDKVLYKIGFRGQRTCVGSMIKIIYREEVAGFPYLNERLR